MPKLRISLAANVQQTNRGVVLCNSAVDGLSFPLLLARARNNCG